MGGMSSLNRDVLDEWDCWEIFDERNRKMSIKYSLRLLRRESDGTVAFTK